MDLSKLSSGPNPPEEVHVVIEIPVGSTAKYEMDKESGVLMVDRFQFTSFGYPANYGFIPHTQASDGDPVDVLVLSSQPIVHGAAIKVRPVGYFETEDESGKDEKILAVPLETVDPFMADIKDIGDVSQAVKNKLRHFYTHYKALEKGKWTKVGEFKDRAAALALIKKSLQ